MTRAEDQFHLMVPQRFSTHGQRSLGDRHVYAQRRRFIPNGLTKYFQRRYWPQSKSSDSEARPEATTRASPRGKGAGGESDTSPRQSSYSKNLNACSGSIRNEK